MLISVFFSKPLGGGKAFRRGMKRAARHPQEGASDFPAFTGWDRLTLVCSDVNGIVSRRTPLSVPLQPKEVRGLGNSRTELSIRIYEIDNCVAWRSGNKVRISRHRRISPGTISHRRRDRRK